MKQIYEEYVQNTICFIGRRGRLRQDGGAQEEDEEREDDQEGCRPHRGTFSLSNVSLHCIQREGEEREKSLTHRHRCIVDGARNFLFAVP